MVARKYTEELLQEAVNNSVSWAGVIRYLGLQDAGGNRSNIQRHVKSFGLSTEHFTGQAHNKGKVSKTKKHFSELLVLMPEGSRKVSSERLRRAMIEYGFDYSCCFWNCPTHNGWINGEIGFEIDHKNGNNIDNRPENLRFICAICHTQQPTSSHSWKNADRYGTKLKCGCGRPKHHTAIVCIECRKTKQIYRQTKIDWPDVDKLQQMVLEYGYSETGRKLGVSRTAVKSHIDKPNS